MSRYHSICLECSYIDENDGSSDDDPNYCFHSFWQIFEHEGHEDEEEDAK